MKRIFMIIVIVVFSCLVTANVPAPWWPCNGKKEGDPCKWGYGCGSIHTCKLMEGCHDDPSTKVNECLQCMD